MLARLARVDPQLLRPIQHRSEQAQEHLRVIRVRAALVEARTMLVNAARGLPRRRGSGCRLRRRSDGRRADGVAAGRAAELAAATAGRSRIVDGKDPALDQQVEQIARTDYPETDLLRQVSGVGTLIALTFVLTVEDRERFQKSRDVGCYVGLRPRQSDSGESEPQLRITKEGDPYLRKLLVQGAHCIMGPRTGYGSKALGVEVNRTWWQERQEAGRGGSGSEAGDSAASVVGNGGSVRTVAEQPGCGAGRQAA